MNARYPSQLLKHTYGMMMNSRQRLTPPLHKRLNIAMSRDSAAGISQVIEDAGQACGSRQPWDVQTHILENHHTQGWESVVMISACGKGRGGNGSPRVLQRWCRWWPGDPSIPEAFAQAATMGRTIAVRHMLDAMKACGPDHCRLCCLRTPSGLPGWALMQLAAQACPSEPKCEALFEAAIEAGRDDIMAAALRVHVNRESASELANCTRWIGSVAE